MRHRGGRAKRGERCAAGRGAAGGGGGQQQEERAGDGVAPKVDSFIGVMEDACPTGWGVTVRGRASQLVGRSAAAAVPHAAPRRAPRCHAGHGPARSPGARCAVWLTHAPVLVRPGASGRADGAEPPRRALQRPHARADQCKWVGCVRGAGQGGLSSPCHANITQAALPCATRRRPGAAWQRTSPAFAAIRAERRGVCCASTMPLPLSNQDACITGFSRHSFHCSDCMAVPGPGLGRNPVDSGRAA